MEIDLSASFNGSIMNEGDALNRSSVAGSVQTRICEYCEVKLDNPQVDKYFELGKNWRKQDYDQLIYKLDWFEDTNKDLDAHLRKESKVLTQAEIDFHAQRNQL
jgi:hypothetical protein